MDGMCDCVCMCETDIVRDERGKWEVRTIMIARIGIRGGSIHVIGWIERKEEGRDCGKAKLGREMG